MKIKYSVNPLPPPLPYLPTNYHMGFRFERDTTR